MDTPNRSKLNQVFKKWQRNQVITSASLHLQGVNNELIKSYVRSGWLTRIGTGAFLRVGDELNWYAAIEAIQTQLNIGVHVGGENALKLQGISDQIERIQSGGTLHLYTNRKSKLPRWFLKSDLKVTVKLHQDTLFNSPPEKSIQTISIDHHSVQISCRERAILEFLNEVPNTVDFDSVYPIFVQLGTLRAPIIQELLEKCNSIKVKRLFLYLSRESNHAWYSKIDKSQIQLGRGKRELVKKGILDPEFLITVSMKREDTL